MTKNYDIYVYFKSLMANRNDAKLNNVTIIDRKVRSDQKKQSDAFGGTTEMTKN